jgi:hypothetical protein
MPEYYLSTEIENFQPAFRAFYLLAQDDIIKSEEFMHIIASQVSFLNLIIDGTVKNEGKIVVNKTLTINNKIINNNIIEIGG